MHISDRAKAEADVVKLRKYVTLLFKETKVTLNMRKRSLNGLKSWIFLDADKESKIIIQKKISKLIFLFENLIN